MGWFGSCISYLAKETGRQLVHKAIGYAIKWTISYCRGS